MKKIFNIFILLFVLANFNVQAQNAGCCPKFSLVAGFQPCDETQSCKEDAHNGGTAPGNPTGGTPSSTIIACKNQAHRYFVVPNLTGYTYTWTVIGGTPASPTGNPMTITWGNSNQGFIQVTVISPDKKCKDTIKAKLCLIDGPTAAFTFSPNPVCPGTPVCFNSTPSLGASNYYWDFGDGTTSTLPNPCHIYATGGNYPVILTVSGAVADTAGNMKDCGCKDTAKMIVNVGKLPGIDIHTDDCRKMLCAGDTVKYCTSTTGCTSLNWAADGGTVISGQGTTCATIVWNNPGVYPSAVKLNANCPGTCGNSATLQVPVLFPAIPIQGPIVVCAGSTATYSLPALPGTFYHWTISGGGAIANYDSNHNVINVIWGNTTGGPFTITCNYNNPYSGCSGTGTISVNIKPKFQIIGLTSICTTYPAGFSVVGGGSANWNVLPTTGYAPPGVPPGTFNGSPNLNLTWSVPSSYTINAVPVTPANYCTPAASLNIIVNATPALNPITGNTIVCPNQLYNYTASSNVTGGNFNWSFLSGTGNIAPYGSNNSLAAINFTGTGPWVLQVTQTVNGCTGSITLPITAVPPPPPIPAVGSVCSGGSVTFTLPGVVPPGGYTWSSTPGAVITGAPTGLTATFVVNSNATITVSNCAGSSSINVTATAATVTITKVPGSCSATLTASPGGGTYNWFLNGNPAGSGNPKVVTQNGTYVVQATYAGGCIAVNQIIVTGITPVVATISAIGNLCNGGSVTLQAPIPANCPGATFTWSNGATGNPITVNTPGSYYVTVNCSNGCTATSNVIVVQPCVIGPGCINDLVISPSNCPNPVALTTSIPTGCTPVSTMWYYGDGYGGTTGNHTYANVGAYTVYAVLTCSNGSVHCGSQNITVPMVDSFTRVISCGVNSWNIQLQDASMYLPAYAGYTITWSTTCGTLSAINIPNPTLTVPFGCNPTVTLSISKNGCPLTKSVTFSFPNTPLSIIGPSVVCKGDINAFSSSFTTGVLSYAWNFGDATTGVTNPINHAFNGIPTNPVINMSITDQYGCVFSATKPVTVNIPTPLTITPSPLVKICPDCLPPTTLSTNPPGSFSGYQWYHDGVAIPAATNPTYQLCTFNASGNYYVKATSINNNCRVTSDTVKVVYNPKPLADIIGQTVQCVSGAAPYNLFLQNSGGTNPNYTYNWTVTGPGTVTFSPNNTQSYASVTVSQLGSYQFILTVTDITTKCVAKDTFCVFAYLSPSLTVTAPTQMCAGTMYTMTANATPPNPNYIYQWNNGATTASITTSQAGNYSVTVVDPVSGCMASAFAGTIKKTPYTDLFPLGCDTLCDTAKIIPPLPLAPGQNYNGVYQIKWYVDGNYYYTGPFLILTGLSPIPGQHQIYIVVKDIVTGCTSTSGKYDLYIKHCGDCNCKESHWGDIALTKGEKIDEKNKETQNVIIDKVKLECKGTYDLKCNQTYTVTGAYNCADKSCPPKTTYSLQPPTGSPITGTNSITFTPTVNGAYILTIYGWCGGKICDSCVIRFKVKCVPDCDCRGSKWGEKTYTINNGTKPIDCTNPKPIEVKCKQPISINATYYCASEKCNSAVTYTLQQPSGTTTGTVPLTFTPTQSGTYTVTLYGWCGNTVCDSCVIKFVVICDEPCCPYDIKVDTSSVKYDYTKIPNATLVSETYSISGLGMANITEVRANVVSYVITDNFGKECMKCVNLPFTWASTASATNIGVASPKITMYGGTTVPSFNGSGTGAYQNPREITWKNSPIAIPNGTNVGINFIVPPVPAIDCCELKGRICVKFTFRDNDCKECEVIQCFEFVIRKK